MMFKIPVNTGEFRVSASTTAGCSGARAHEHRGVYLTIVDLS
jgi:hypothetical protein